MRSLLILALAAGTAGATGFRATPIIGAGFHAAPVAGISGLPSIPALPASFAAQSLGANLHAQSPAVPGANSPAPANAEAPSAASPAPASIGLVQYDADVHFGDYDHNLRALTAMAEDAVRKGAKIVVMPEGSLYGYASKDELWCKPGMTDFHGRRCRDVSAVAERVPAGRSTAYWEAFAKLHGVYVIFNVPETDGTNFYNALGVVGPLGYVATYRKRMLYRTDQAYATAGTEPVVLKTEHGCFGLLVCLDAHPDSPYFEEYKKLEADALIIAMDWDDDPRGAYAAKLKFREWAKEHNIDIYASDAAPWDGTARYLASGDERERKGLPPDAVGVEGLSLHPLKPK